MNSWRGIGLIVRNGIGGKIRRGNFFKYPDRKQKTGAIRRPPKGHRIAPVLTFSVGLDRCRLLFCCFHSRLALSFPEEDAKEYSQ